MMSVLHLLWNIPLAVSLGFLTAALLAADIRALPRISMNLRLSKLGFGRCKEST